MRRFAIRCLRDESGATSIEYAVMLSLIAGVCIASVLVMSNAAGASLDNSAAELSSAFGS
ncbi:MAG: Flp family type IVb pilin [Planctomycetota bacterium]